MGVEEQMGFCVALPFTGLYCKPQGAPLVGEQGSELEGRSLGPCPRRSLGVTKEPPPCLLGESLCWGFQGVLPWLLGDAQQRCYPARDQTLPLPSSPSSARQPSAALATRSPQQVAQESLLTKVRAHVFPLPIFQRKARRPACHLKPS